MNREEYLEQKLERIRRQIPVLLDGIDRDEMDNKGWWKSDIGVGLGKAILRSIDNLFEDE